MSEPGLFVVCKNCGSEVSPYVTECPYCGQRVRKRAPRLDRGEPGEEPRRKRRTTRRMPSLGRIRRDEIPGIAPDTRPYATMALIAVAIGANLALATQQVSYLDLGLLLPGKHELWRMFASPFLHANAGYELVTLGTVAIFGTHLERRFGWAFRSRCSSDADADRDPTRLALHEPADARPGAVRRRDQEATGGHRVAKEPGKLVGQRGIPVHELVNPFAVAARAARDRRLVAAPPGEHTVGFRGRACLPLRRD